jgi:hypothetical protein
MRPQGHPALGSVDVVSFLSEMGFMLRCNMESVMDMNNHWDLDDLLADLHHARKRGDLGRLAFVAYCDVRRWARDAGKTVLAEQAARLITESPHSSRDVFVEQIDQLIRELEILQSRGSAPSQPAPLPSVFWPNDAQAA